MTPVASFLVTPNLLVIKFTDTSTGNPASWLWDFGDSTPTDTTQNPSHTYTTPGTYIVKLTVTNSDGNSSVQRTIVISDTPILPVSLRTFTQIKLPSTLQVSDEEITAYISQWQLYIQPLVNPAVTYNNVFNESAYPPLANALIAMLAAYSIISNQVSNATVSGSIGGTGTNKATVKRIKTEISEVEFQNQNDATDNVLSKDGILNNLAKEICTLAFRLNINLPMCPPLAKPIFLNLKAGRVPTVPNWWIWPIDYNLAI